MSPEIYLGRETSSRRMECSVHPRAKCTDRCAAKKRARRYSWFRATKYAENGSGNDVARDGNGLDAGAAIGRRARIRHVGREGKTTEKDTYSRRHSTPHSNLTRLIQTARRRLIRVEERNFATRTISPRFGRSEAFCLRRSKSSASRRGREQTSGCRCG